MGALASPTLLSNAHSSCLFLAVYLALSLSFCNHIKTSLILDKVLCFKRIDIHISLSSSSTQLNTILLQLTVKECVHHEQRLSGSAYLESLIPICPPTEDMMPKRKQVYSREFQQMLDNLKEEDCLETACQHGEKKRRLTPNQINALEKNFELENKLAPERKVKLAAELDLQPRQVAIWFQNRRARWRTKQLERDYNLLKASYDALQLDFSNLEREKETLTAQLMELRAKLKAEEEVSLKISQQNHQLMAAAAVSSSLHFNGGSSSSESSMQWFKSFNSGMIMGNMNNTQFMKVEEQSTLFSTEDSCNIFSLDQAPTLQWYFPAGN
ncbi:hypothetical protein SLE2022_325910 [Rubroshorea leprosula]